MANKVNCFQNFNNAKNLQNFLIIFFSLPCLIYIFILFNNYQTIQTKLNKLHTNS